MKNEAKLFITLNYTFLLLFALSALYPVINIVIISVMPSEEYLRSGIVLFPKRISFDAYLHIFNNGNIFTAYRSTLIITFMGTFTNLFLTILCAYGLSKTNLKGYKFFVNIIIFTMYFKGGLIPSYMLMRSLHLIDTYWAVIFSGAISTYNMLVLRSFFLNIPESLEEAAVIDGASEPYILFKIILPITLPAIAAIGLFYAVGQWNSYFLPMVYLNSRKMWPLQVILKEILFESTESMRSTGETIQQPAAGQQLKMATVIITILPITMVYPLLQKHFIKGVLIGAVKE